MKYKSVVATRLGGPEVLQVVDTELRAPSAGEARIRVAAASVCRPDVTARTGEALYAGTPLGRKPPFVPGYAVVGTVDAVGADVTAVAVGDRVGALMVVGGYSEFVYWRQDRLFPVPESLDPAEAVTLILNYVVAYQALHRSAKVKPGEKVLLIGASGGIGTALLQLGRLAGLKMYGLASPAKHAILAEYGAIPVDYHRPDFAEVIRQAEPGGLDAVVSGVMSVDYVRVGLSLLRNRGRLVAFGEPDGFAPLFRILAASMTAKLPPARKSIRLYGTSFYFIGDRQPFLDDWALLFQYLQEGKIKPVIEKRFPIHQAAQANALLETGSVTGNLVLISPEGWGR
jgi:NADPH:quinone reductase-like Zn-dependent oxidoreductase